MTEILTNIAEYSVVVALLVVMVIYFMNKEKKKDTEISDLHKELRETEKENLTLLLKISALMDKLSVNNDAILGDIKNLKEFIKDRLDKIEK